VDKVDMFVLVESRDLVTVKRNEEKIRYGYQSYVYL